MDAINFFKENGFAVVKNFLTHEEVQSLQKECAEIVNKMVPSEHFSVFETGKNQVGDQYFLDSGDKISFFFEKEAFNSKAELVVKKAKALNKIGHALHWLNPVFKRITFSKKVKDLLIHLGYYDPVVTQSMYIFKHPEIGGEVVPHQDSTYLYTEPPSALGLWFPLVDVTKENGCLWFIPGSHKSPVYQRFIRNPEKSPLLLLNGNLPEQAEDTYVSVEAKAGDCVIIHGSVIHRSGKNTSSCSRPVYTFHVVEKGAKYASENWLQPTQELPFPSVYEVTVSN